MPKNGNEPNFDNNPVSDDRNPSFDGELKNDSLSKSVSSDINGVSDGRNGVSVNMTPTETPQSKVNIIISSSKGKPETNDEDFAEIATLFSDNIHSVFGEIERDMLIDYYNEYGKKWVLEAIKEAALRHGRSVKYIGGILEQWKDRGFKVPPKGKESAKRGGTGGNRRKVEIEGLDDFDEAEERQKRNRPWDVQPQPGGDGETPGTNTPS